MTDLHYLDDDAQLVHPMYDAVGPLADAVVCPTGEFLGSGGVGVVAQGFNARQYAAHISFGMPRRSLATEALKRSS